MSNSSRAGGVPRQVHKAARGAGETSYWDLSASRSSLSGANGLFCGSTVVVHGASPTSQPPGWWIVPCQTFNNCGYHLWAAFNSCSTRLQKVGVELAGPCEPNDFCHDDFGHGVFDPHCRPSVSHTLKAARIARRARDPPHALSTASRSLIDRNGPQVVCDCGVNPSIPRLGASFRAGSRSRPGIRSSGYHFHVFHSRIPKSAEPLALYLVCYSGPICGGKMLRREDIPLAVMSIVSLAILLAFAVSVLPPAAAPAFHLTATAGLGARSNMTAIG